LISDIYNVFLRFYPQFFSGLVTTLHFSALTVLLGTLCGALMAMAKMSRFMPLRLVVTAYIEIIRGTPLLLQIFIISFLIPMLTDIRFSLFNSVLIAFVANSTAYVSEIIRAGIQAVDKGQSEAARSLGLTKTQTMVRVILPQGVKNILPPLLNEFIMIIKETALASVFFLGDLMTQVNVIRGATFLTVEPLIIAGFMYFIVTFTLSKLVAVYERRLAASD
jgi:His/Glu/Gln/Arg/opine family amino acid ABC transporter permease subunit